MSIPPIPPGDTGALALYPPAPRSSGGLVFWGILWGCVGGLAEAVGLIVLGALFRQDLLQVSQVDTMSTVLVATCLVLPSLLAAMCSRKVVSGVIAGALVTPVMLAISSLYYVIAFGAQMVAGPELAITGV